MIVNQEEDHIDLNDISNGHELEALPVFTLAKDTAENPLLKAVYFTCIADLFVYYLGKDFIPNSAQFYIQALTLSNTLNADLTLFIAKKLNVVNELTNNQTLLSQLKAQIEDLESLKRDNPKPSPELINIFQTALEYASTSNQVVAKQLCLINLGDLMLLYSKKKEAVEYFDQAFSTLASRQIVWILLNKLGDLTVEVQMWEKANKYSTLMLDFINIVKTPEIKGINNPFTRMEPFVFIRRAITCSYMGLKEEADEYFVEAKKLFRTITDNRDKSLLLFKLGRYKLVLNHLKESKSFMEESLKLADKLGDKELSQTILLNIIDICTEAKDKKSLDKYTDKALKYFKQKKDPKKETRTIITIIQSYLYLDDVEKAGKLLGQIKEMNIQNENLKAHFFYTMANFSNRTGQDEQCKEFFKLSLDIAKKLEDKTLECRILGDMGDSYNKIGDYEESRKLTNEALILAMEIGDKDKECIWTGNMGEIAENKGDKDEARKYYELALDLANSNYFFYWQEYWQAKLNEL